MAESKGLQPITAELDMLPPSSILPLSFTSSHFDTRVPQKYAPVCTSSSLATGQRPSPDRSPRTQPRRLALSIAPSFEQVLQETSGGQQVNNGSTTMAASCKGLKASVGVTPSIGPTTTSEPLIGAKSPSHPGHTVRRENHKVCADMVGIISMSQTSEVSPGRLREAIDRRTETLCDISPDAVHNALAGLLNAPPDAPPFHDLAVLSLNLGCEPCRLATMVDDESNPWSAYILLFIDTLLVLYRPVATSPIALLHGYGESDENDEMDQVAFGATAATALGSRVLFLIPHAHHHVIKALWFALMYLSMAYFGSERGVAFDFLLERIDEEWGERERYAAQIGKPCWSDHLWENGVEAEWYRRAHTVEGLRRAHKARGGVWVGVVWTEMKGLRARSNGREGAREDVSPRGRVERCSESANPPQRVVPVTIPSAAYFTPATTPPTPGFERGKSGEGLERRISLSPDD